MTIDLSELNRRACEVVGWTLEPGDWSEFARCHFYIHHNGKVVENTGFYCIREDPEWLEHLPAIATDPGVAISEFQKWLLAHKYSAAIEFEFDGRPSCRVFNRLAVGGVYMLTMQFGDTVSEAICRAIIQTSQQENHGRT